MRYIFPVLSLLFMLLVFQGQGTQSQQVETVTEPAVCGQFPERIEISPHYAPVIGSWPLWSTISQENNNTLFNLSPHVNAGLAANQRHKVLWLVNTRYQGEVVLRGFHLEDDSPMYFSFGGASPVTIATLDPKNPGAYAFGSERFANFPS